MNESTLYTSVLLFVFGLVLGNPPTAIAQSVLLRPGDVVESSFSSMVPGSHELQLTSRPVWEIGGTLALTRPDLHSAFRLDLFGADTRSPFWSYTFDVDPTGFPSLKGTFGAADIGSPWGQGRGQVRFTLLSGQPLFLSDLVAYQSFPAGDSYVSYQAVLTVPEPSVISLFGVSCAALFGLFRRRSRLTSSVERTAASAPVAHLGFR